MSPAPFARTRKPDLTIVRPGHVARGVDESWAIGQFVLGRLPGGYGRPLGEGFGDGRVGDLSVLDV